MSDRRQAAVDRAIKKLLSESYERVKILLQKR